MAFIRSNFSHIKKGLNSFFIFKICYTMKTDTVLYKRLIL
ncbi:hypothetical protein LEP1GSC133_1734 [Leptospira borgpetersenii serovar Pomona str. 200901868]|uniref:Uncharacterized protein n=1 Tax=Leptospira borgpetersenii serovar Pomona str. 200901868 TaxID=1192866 RepID=M6WL87_LEPBO|nr:hypothetical protein LEP1GSC133_1734 [Leptospira borgpetersenii serovar Pomona str. 200901868]